MLGPGQTLFDSSNHCLSVCVSMSGSLSGVLGRRLALSSKLVFSATERHIFHVCTAAMACAVGELASMRRRKSRFAPEVFFCVCWGCLLAVACSHETLKMYAVHVLMLLLRCLLCYSKRYCCRCSEAVGDASNRICHSQHAGHW